MPLSAVSLRLRCRQPVLSLDTFKIINLSGMWWLFVIGVGEMIKIRLETRRNTRQILVSCRKPAHPAQDVGPCLVLNYKGNVRTLILMRNVLIILDIPTNEIGSASSFQLPCFVCFRHGRARKHVGHTCQECF